MFKLSVIFLILTTSIAAADISGSSIDFFGPWTADTGDTLTFEFHVSNGSLDDSVMDEIIFAFHPCVTVLAGTYDDSGASNFWLYSLDTSTPNIGRWWHPTDDIGSHMVAGEGGTFWLTVVLDFECPCGLLPIDWTLLGFGGAPPHVLSGMFTFESSCPTPAVDSDWGRIKRRY
jgi:hypothetical protein